MNRFWLLPAIYRVCVHKCTDSLLVLDTLSKNILLYNYSIIVNFLMN